MYHTYKTKNLCKHGDKTVCMKKARITLAASIERNFFAVKNMDPLVVLFHELYAKDIVEDQFPEGYAIPTFLNPFIGMMWIIGSRLMTFTQ